MADFDYIPIETTAQKIEEIANMERAKGIVEKQNARELITSTALLKTIKNNPKNIVFENEENLKNWASKNIFPTPNYSPISNAEITPNPDGTFAYTATLSVENPLLSISVALLKGKYIFSTSNPELFCLQFKEDKIQNDEIFEVVENETFVFLISKSTNGETVTLTNAWVQVERGTQKSDFVAPATFERKDGLTANYLVEGDMILIEENGSSYWWDGTELKKLSDSGNGGSVDLVKDNIKLWQPNTEYKVGDVVIATWENEDKEETVIAKCNEVHTSSSSFTNDLVVYAVWDMKSINAYGDEYGRNIYNTYATKKELEEALENIPTGEGGTITVDQTYKPESENAQSGKAVAEAVKSITHEKTTLIGGTIEDWSIAEFTPKVGHKYDLVVEPFTVRAWLSSGYICIEINEYYIDGTSNRVSTTSVDNYNGSIQRITIDNSSGNIQKVEVKLRPETNTEAYVLFGDLESIVVADHKRLDDTETDINAVSRYFVYDKLTADFTTKALNSTYVGGGLTKLNKPIRKGDKVTFRIDAPSGDENQHYFNWYNGGSRITGIANQSGYGSREFEYTHNHEQDITALEFVLVKVIQQNAYTITIYDENSIIKKVEDLSKSVEDVSNGTMQVPDYYKDHLSGAISRAKTNLLNAGVEGETFVFISDLHWESNAKNSPALIGAITNELPIENVIFGGDAFNGGAYEDKVADMNDIRKQFEKVSKRFLSIYGNHDSNHLDGGTGFENREFYTLLQKQNDYLCNFDNPSNNYCFYFDNPTTKTRMILLDTGMTNPYHPAEELAWLQSTVSNAPSGYNILVFAHIIFVPQSGGSYNDPTTWEMTTFMTSVCEYLDSVTDKNVKAIFGGHSHYDYASKTTSGIPIILIDCDARQTGTGNNQTLGSVNEQAFDVVTVNYKTNTVHCVRVGRGTDRTIEKQ